MRLQAQQGGAGDAVTSEAAHLVHAGRTRERIWERSWRLCRHTGFVHRVALQVEEATTPTSWRGWDIGRWRG